MCLSYAPQLRLFSFLLLSSILVLLHPPTAAAVFIAGTAFLFCFVYKKVAHSLLFFSSLLSSSLLTVILRMYIKYIINKVRIRACMCVCEYIDTWGLYRMTDAR